MTFRKCTGSKLAVTFKNLYSIYVCVHAMREINAEQKIAKLARDEELTREESTMKISVL